MIESASERLHRLRVEIERAARASGRLPEDIMIVGVSKFQTAGAVVEMISAGLRDIGENRIQEFAVKWPEIERLLQAEGIEPKDIRRHFIGHLQSNKALEAAKLFDMIHSVDSESLAAKIGIAADRLGRLIECLVQVNTSGEATKSGVEPREAEAVAKAIAAQLSLNFRGLMTIGPLTEDSIAIKDSFDILRQLRDDLEHSHSEWFGKLHLSMGMSGDYPLAIEAGATMIRIGTALFGSRRIGGGDSVKEVV